MTDYETIYLADKPEHHQACAAWAYGRWDVARQNTSLEKSIEKFKNSTNKNKIPLTIISINKETELPIAMGNLWEKHGTEWPDISPWIASVYTHYRHRNQGIATNIIKRLEKEAKSLGYNTVYLKAGAAADIYKKLGYKEIDSIKTKVSQTGKLILFTKQLD